MNEVPQAHTVKRHTRSQWMPSTETHEERVIESHLRTNPSAKPPLHLKGKPTGDASEMSADNQARWDRYQRRLENGAIKRIGER